MNVFERVFDQLTLVVAKPMPRRDMLSLAGKTVAAGFIAHFASKVAVAQTVSCGSTAMNIQGNTFNSQNCTSSGQIAITECQALVQNDFRTSQGSCGSNCPAVLNITDCRCTSSTQNNLGSNATVSWTSTCACAGGTTGCGSVCCGGGQTCCSGACTPTYSSCTSCGACGNVVPRGYCCVNGVVTSSQGGACGTGGTFPIC